MAAPWKKVVVSGSAAQLQSLQVDANVSVTGSLLVSTNQIITSAQSTTQLTGSATAAAVNPWVSASPAVATVSNTGLVTGITCL